MNVSFFLEIWTAGLVRACWQGGLVLLLVWTLCRALPRLSPQVRCWLWRLAYLKLLLAFFVGGAGFLELPLLPSPPATSPAPAGAFVRRAVHAGPVLPETSAPRAVPAPAASFVPVRPAAIAPPLSALFVLWACGVGWFGCRLARQQREMNRLRHSYVPLEETALADCCGLLCRRLGLRQPPRLLTAAHDEHDGPLLTGVQHPAVLLPSTLTAECSPAEIRLILAHELAHLRRRDLIWNWLPALTQMLFFFHPLVWMAGREWRLAQEMAADEAALRVADAPVEDYGALLVRVAARHCSSRAAGSLVALRIVDSPCTLKRRLIAMTTFVPASRTRRRVTAAALLLGAAACLLPWRAVAQQQTPPAAPIVPVLTPPPPAAVATARGTKAIKAPRPAQAPPKKRLAAPVLPIPARAPAAPANATAASLAAPPPPARLVPATRPVVAAPLLAPAAAPSAVPPSDPAAPVVSLATALPSTTPQASVPPPAHATRQDDNNRVAKVIDEQIAAHMETLGEQAGPQMAAKGQEIGALAEQLSHSDLSNERRAELTRQLTTRSQEMAGLVVPLVRQALRAAMPEIRRQTELGVTTGKVSAAEIRGELDRALADVKSDTADAGLSLAQRGEIGQLIREVRQEVEKGIRAGIAAREKMPSRSAAPTPARKTP